MAAINQFAKEASVLEERPTVLLYFAGHGIQRDGRNHLLPVNFSTDDLEQIDSKSVELDQITAALSRASASIQIVVLDACRNDPFQSLERSARPVEQGLVKVAEGRGQLIAFSTAPGKTASDGETGTSPYASALAESVLMPGLSIRQTFDRVRVKVKERTKGQQEPWETSSLYQEFTFVPPIQNTVISEVEGLLWDNVALLDSAEAYQRYVDRFPNGMFAKIARQKIENINRDFSFRRSSETFPIVQSVDGKLDFCLSRSEKSNLPPARWQLDAFQDFDGELVFANLAIPLKNMMCPKGGNDGLRMTAVAPKPDECNTLMSIDSGEAGGLAVEFTCTSETERDSRVTSEYSIDKAGGLSVSDFVSALVLAAGQHSFYDYEFFENEGMLDGTEIRVTGLVRVHTSTQEEHLGVELEPIDPAVLGLSWKYQATLETLRKGKEASGAKYVSLYDFGVEAYAAVSEPSGNDIETGPNDEPVRIWETMDLTVADDGDISSIWNHNNSTMGLVRKGKERAILYLEPRDGLFGLGIEAGSPLFEGIATDDSTYHGWSYTYSANCGSLNYETWGKVSPDNKRIVIQGTAPKLDDECREIGKRKVSMTFDFLRRFQSASAN